jgi:hypothetical protein
MGRSHRSNATNDGGDCAKEDRCVEHQVFVADVVQTVLQILVDGGSAGAELTCHNPVIPGFTAKRPRSNEV